jgi:hypothetical protein
MWILMWNTLTWIIYFHGGEIWTKCLNICSGVDKHTPFVPATRVNERQTAGDADAIERCRWNIYNFFYLF